VLLPKDGSYNLTEHFVTTADGYVLRLFRLLHARAHPEPRPVVYLQHALLDSAAGKLHNTVVLYLPFSFCYRNV
jgi:hypothetical protein